MKNTIKGVITSLAILIGAVACGGQAAVPVANIREAPGSKMKYDGK